MRRVIVVAALIVGLIGIAVPAQAEGPDVNSSCQGAELNKTATASNGTAVRCLANDQGGFSWMADTGAVGTIADLEKEGYTVTIDRVGSAPLDQCKVTDVRNPNTITRTNRSGPGASNVTTIVVSKTIHVSLDCTAKPATTSSGLQGSDVDSAVLESITGPSLTDLAYGE